MSRLADSARFISGILEKNNIPYAVIGSVASSAHGIPRATRDTDLIVAILPHQVDDLLSLIEESGLKISKKKDVSKKLKSGKPAKVIWEKKYSFDLRLATFEIDQRAISNATGVFAFKNVLLSIASPEDIIVYKIVRFDDFDKKDIKGILKTQKLLDWDYIDQQALILAKQIGNPKILKNLEKTKKWIK